MTNFTSFESRVNATKAIGRGERLTAELTDFIVGLVPDGFDPKARGAVSGLVLSVVDPDGAQVQKKGKKGEQITTDFGRGIDTLVRSVKKALAGEKAPTDWLRLVRQAAENAHNKGHVDEDAIMAAVREALASVEESDAA